MSIKHCRRCSEFDRFCRDENTPKPLEEFLSELWFEHQDIKDDLRCWNAYCALYCPEEVGRCGDD